MEFTAYARTLQGTGASRRLRNAQKVPGIVYGAGEPALIELDHNALFFALKKEAFHSSILEMSVDGKVQKVLLRDFQMHPYKPQVLHIDFQRVSETTRLRKKVPLHFKGQDESPAVKTDKCVVSHVMSELEVECQASALPEFIEIDLSSLERGQTMHVSDLKLPRGIRAVRRGSINPTVVTATVPVEETEEAPALTPVTAPEKGAAKKKDEKQNKK